MFAHPHARGLWPYNLHTFMPATADAATDGVASLRPAQLDLSRSDEELRPTFLAALSSLTPCLSVVNHGCEERLRSLARAMQQRIEPNAVASKAYAQQAHEFHEHAELAPAAAEVRSCLREVCVRVLGIAAADMPEALREQELDVRGRLCLREYPKQQADAADSSSDGAPPASAAKPPPLRLGAHCDSTLLTLLWADAPGLQVLEPRRAEALGWRPQHVLGLGLPTMMPLADPPDDEAASGEGGAAAPEPPPLTDEQWAYIDVDWPRDPLLLTIGASWLSSELMRERCPARCAALHRVVLPPGTHKRLSLPFLADLVSSGAAPAGGDR